MLRDSVDGIATRYGLDSPGIESWCGRDFPHPTRPSIQRVLDLSWGVKRPGRGVDHPAPPRLKKE